MAGIRKSPAPVRFNVTGYKQAAVAANDILMEAVFPFLRGRISSIAALAVTAGTTSGNTVLDVQKNGTTVFTTAARKPTLAAASTGEFAILQPDGAINLVAGDRITILVASIPDTTGHAKVMCSVSVDVL